jgi:hypothetical protein
MEIAGYSARRWSRPMIQHHKFELSVPVSDVDHLLDPSHALRLKPYLLWLPLQ